MNRNRILQICIIAALLLLVFVAIFNETAIMVYAQLIYISSQSWTWIVLAVLIVIVFLWFVFGTRLEIKHRLWSIGGIGSNLSKVHPLKSNIEAAIEFMKPTGIDERSKAKGGCGLSVKLTQVDSPDADIPLCIVMLSCEPRREGHRQPVKQTNWYNSHFLIVDRRTNEVSYNCDINTMKEAQSFKNQIRNESLPLEKRKSQIDKLTEGILHGYTGRIGEHAATPKDDAEVIKPVNGGE